MSDFAPAKQKGWDNVDIHRRLSCGFRTHLWVGTAARTNDLAHLPSGSPTALRTLACLVVSLRMACRTPV